MLRKHGLALCLEKWFSWVKACMTALEQTAPMQLCAQRGNGADFHKCHGRPAAFLYHAYFVATQRVEQYKWDWEAYKPKQARNTATKQDTHTHTDTHTPGVGRPIYASSPYHKMII